MALNTLSLPVDIPWKRICVSPDMVERTVCDRRFPYRWRSSLAVFSYEPPEEDQTYEDMLVTYLKVTATITGFQADANEVGIKNRLIHGYWLTPEAVANYEDAVGQYYGCYGAILEVAIAPPVSLAELRTMPPEHFPYFIDFQPKKRELYEVVSETGEVMSRTLEGVSVQKGTTSTRSHENLDILTGQSGEASIFYGLVQASGSRTGQWGTKDVSGEDYSNTRSTDESRERRETQSHTTQYSQMYHQFTAYHLGTNRAVFYMLPRPRIVQSDHTFVNGPRALEGIQDVFLIAMRRRNTPMFCVEAYLETAHIAATPIKEYRAAPSKLLHLHVPPMQPVGDKDYQFWLFNEGSETVQAPEGQEVDLDKGGYKVESTSGSSGGGPPKWTITPYPDRVTAWGQSWSKYVEGDFFPGELDLKATVFLRYSKPETVGYDTTLWLTGRGLCCCPSKRTVSQRPLMERPSLVREVPLRLRLRKPVGRDLRMTISEANEATAQIGREVLRSIDAPDRHAFGEREFLDAQFIADSVARAIAQPDNPDDVPVRDIAGLDRKISAKVARSAPAATRRSLLLMSLSELGDRFDLSQGEARALRRAALGLAGPAPEGAARWTRRTRSRVVPDLSGLPHDVAQRLLWKNKLGVSPPAQLDSGLPRDTVVRQNPAGGTSVPEWTPVELALASGAIVVIPDIRGTSLPVALGRLRAAGLESKPLIEGRGGRAARVSGVRPRPGTPVTPNARVTLTVGGAGGRGK
ncbi:MAG: PASTA domain-containing protein [Proteobacteria bacterium]|nr:PASTA domain-containing protein [Pseudomonadota bacterium]